MLSNEYLVLSDSQKKEIINKIEKHFYNILKDLKFDVDKDIQIKESPLRIAKMYVNELFQGNYSSEPKITVFDNTRNYDEMVLLGPIQIKSVCSHHFIPFVGNCYIAYLPNKKVIGISKLSRIVKWYMRRPQIQEELTKQIANYIQEKLKPKGVAVFIEASHMCMIMRGVEESQNSKMKTSCLYGEFKKPEVRQEFFNMISK